MRNLLPEHVKAELKTEYRNRVFVVGTLLFSVALVIGALSLFPLYIISEARENIATKRLLETNASADTSTAPASSEALRVRSKLDALEGIKTEVSFAERIAILVTNKNEGVALTSFVYDRGELTEDSTLFIEGRAESRDELLLFKERLEAEEDFTSVELPISNLAENRDIFFSITVRGSF